MKTIDEISRLSAEDLERISLDESIPVPEELSGKVREAVTKSDDAAIRAHRLRWTLPATGIAAAVAVLVTIGLTRNPEPQDTFDDPYLAYAEVEKVFSKISGAVAYGAEKVNESEQTLDKFSYWK
jgi:hypothetical protein